MSTAIDSVPALVSGTTIRDEIVDLLKSIRYATGSASASVSVSGSIG